mmetsp:Transcript_63664/g.205118  ORF Transcript_63664/g.205118 Transcript_63664/m.205118 type:complete len:289 (-) Transcript_63664:333-1199(-)
MPAVAAAIGGLALVCLRIALVAVVGPQGAPAWATNLLKADWWVLQPALWVTSVKTATDLNKQKSELQNRIKEADAARARADKKAVVAAALSVGTAATATASAVGATVVARRQALQEESHALRSPAPWLASGPSAKSGVRQTTALMSAAAGGMATLAAVRAVRRARPFHDQVYTERRSTSLRHTVIVHCPGVTRSNVRVNVLPRLNGAEVTISRNTALGVEAAAWKKLYSFPWSEGNFECKQEELQLEQGILTVVFEAGVNQDRVIRLPAGPALAFDMAASDACMQEAA